MSICNQPTVTKVTVTEEPDIDSDPYDFRTRFHWERFGREVEIDVSEYDSPFYQNRYRHKFDFDDENHPIYTPQPGATIVIDSSDRYDNDDPRRRDRPPTELLAELTDDAKLIRKWQQDRWHYIGIIVTATVSVTVTTESNYTMTFTDTESQSLWGIENGLSKYADEQRDNALIIKELTDELKSTLTERGILWPESINTQEVAA